MATKQTPVPLEHISLNATNRSARELARMAMEGHIDVDTPYQRGDVWTHDQRIALVRSWLSGVPVPAIIVNNRTFSWWTDTEAYNVYEHGPRYVVIDGRQRIQTAIAWFSNELAVPASWFDSEHVEHCLDTPDGPYVRYQDLSKVGQRLMANRAMLPMAEGNLPTLRAEADVYLLVNGGGTPQTDEDMTRARLIANE